jgi:23S rRNA (adenine2030-N6)-methyltransferase
MRYHHSFHAGNFADVHKHVALLALLSALQMKPKGFLYLDTHAASGLADLASAEARRSAEAEQGWLRLAPTAAAAPPIEAIEITAWRDAVLELQRRCGAQHYPGSPLLAALSLREHDRGIAAEAQAPTARALERHLNVAGLTSRLRVETGDGFRQLATHWPPRERRSLALIDPPYESADEWTQALESVRLGLERFESGVAAVWFPVKRERELERMLARVSTVIARPALAALLWTHPLDSAAGLNGSGMLIVNPPYAMSQRLPVWQQELHRLLGAQHGGSEVRWLVHER